MNDATFEEMRESYTKLIVAANKSMYQARWNLEVQRRRAIVSEIC